jgi:hypothetical protein
MRGLPKYRFRFSLRMLLVLIAVVAIVLVATVSDDPRAIQGRWQGTGAHESYSLSIQGEMLVIGLGNSPLLEPVASRFELAPRSGQIDIQRSEGTQLGLYDLNGDELTLNLADVNRPRPTSLAAAKNAQQRYIFKRSVPR